MLRLLARLGERQDSMNPLGRGQNKIRLSISFRQKNNGRARFSDAEKRALGKADNVKTSPKRQAQNKSKFNL